MIIGKYINETKLSPEIESHLCSQLRFEIKALTLKRGENPFNTWWWCSGYQFRKKNLNLYSHLTKNYSKMD